MNKLFLALLFTFTAQIALTQIVWTDPAFPSQDENMTFFYNASLGNGEVASVVPMYIHTGVITNVSTGPSDWQHVVGVWGTPDSDVLMTNEGDGIHSFDFNGQTLADFYSLDTDEVIEKIACVFRNAAGTLVGREYDGNDIFYCMPEGAFSIQALTNVPACGFVHVGDELDFTFLISENADLELYVDGELVDSASDSNEISWTGTATASGQLEIECIADNGSEVNLVEGIAVVGDPVVSNPPAGVENGINYISGEAVILQLDAPFKNFVFAIGDFNDWETHGDYLLNQTTDGEHWWIELAGLTPEQEYRYQYVIGDECQKIGDVYSEKILDPWNDPWMGAETYPGLIEYPTTLTSGIVSVFQTNQSDFAWTDENYERPEKEQLIVYELLLRDFLGTHSYQALKDTLDYLENLNISAIELMPINEFEGNESWGYNPMYFFAPDKYYGSAEALKELVDECHARDIAVILDIALNHSFGQNPQVQMYFDPEAGDWGQPSPDNPWFNQVPKHDFSVGYDYDHESPRVREFTKRVLEHWLEVFHVDGFRMDLSKGFTQNNTLGNTGAWGQYDQSRVDILNDYFNHTQSTEPGSYFILEHFTDNGEETVLSNSGMMLWGNLSHEYGEASMGWSSNLTWGSYQARGWNDPHLVSYMESHDEERMMYKNVEFGNNAGVYNVTSFGTALDRVELCANLFIPIPGPKMIWQMGELGYDFSINYCMETGTIDEECRTSPKPIKWEYWNMVARRDVYHTFRCLNHLKLTEPAFSTNDYGINLGGTFKMIHLNHESMEVVCVGNFGVVAQDAQPYFQYAGTWHDYFTGESLEVTDPNMFMNFAPGEYKLWTSEPVECPDMTTDVAEIMGFDSGLHVFPNPTSDRLFIDLVSFQGETVAISLIDLQGRQAKTIVQNHHVAKNPVLEITQLQNISSGMYVLRVVGLGKTDSVSIMIN